MTRPSLGKLMSTTISSSEIFVKLLSDDCVTESDASVGYVIKSSAIL